MYIHVADLMNTGPFFNQEKTMEC